MYSSLDFGALSTDMPTNIQVKVATATITVEFMCTCLNTYFIPRRSVNRQFEPLQWHIVFAYFSTIVVNSRLNAFFFDKRFVGLINYIQLAMQCIDKKRAQKPCNKHFN